ncbi:MAG TPA: hypothetical protein ENI05_08095 [Porticoccus sp.]|nr:hypothetical protein [Porticoccus sp.]
MNDKSKDITSVIRIDDKDWFLQNLINMVNSGELKFGITLNVGGFLVSGNLIGGKHYFEGFGADFASGFSGDEVEDEIKNAFAKNGEIYSSEEEPSPPIYVHIEDAKFFNTNGAPIPENKGVWWRGRVSEVSGFSLGSLSEGDT